ncbi:MAG: hypothetical protein NTU63_02605 [Candidatus Pacearchaeota archaeon]|nr:hypothetical protein [Candidatus Pacearchaeota archaeon]
MKIKKSYLTIGIIVLLLIVGWLFVRFVIGGDEDSWIKDEKGIWIKHGNPAEIPNYVLKQQNVINCAIGKFNEVAEEVNSQCLGTCEDYAVDIVHVPRTSEDDLIENQCDAYRNEQVNHFIELDKNGEIVRIL